MVRVPACVALAILVAAAGCGRTHHRTASPATAPTSASTAPATTPAPGPATTSTTTPATTTSTTAPARAETGRLADAIEDFTSAQRVPFSIVATDLATGAGATHLADRRVLSASLYKLFVARELLRRIAEGSLDRNAAAGDSGGNTVGGCIRLMIVVSDNPCGVAGLQMVGFGAQDAALARDGFTGTSLASPQRTTAQDVARFLVRTRDGTLLTGPHGPAVSAELYGLLNQQQVNDRLPTGLPAGTTLAHKTGDRIGWAHDAAIVHAPGRDLLIVVLSGPWASPCCDADHPGPAERVAFSAIADIGRRLYDAALSP